MSMTIWYKTPLIRLLIVLSGIILLVGVNLLLLVPWSGRTGVIMTVVGGLLSYRLMRNTGGIRYMRQSNGNLSIRLPGGKTVDLPANKIESIRAVEATPLTWRQHIGVKRLGDVRYITTSDQHLYEITISDGRKIIISPRSPKKIFTDI